MQRRRNMVGALLAVALASCTADQPDWVKRADHDAFYLWSGIGLAPDLAHARTFYILGFEVPREGAPRALQRRPGVPRLGGRTVWLVVRSARLDWTGAMDAQIARELARWQAAGNRVAGLQVDFDATTAGLGDYAAWLKNLRGRLDPRWRLSVTGLMDWGANADPRALASLRGVVDEVVVQTYQGRHSIPGYDHYLSRIVGLPVPYRVAVVEGGEWREPAGLRADPQYRGTVVFLLPAPAK